MWGSIDISNANINEALGQIYRSTGYTFNLPLESVDSVKGVSLSFFSNTGSWPVVSTGGNNRSTIGYWLFNGGSARVSGGLSYRCTGTWK